jgi:hypothetical protein
MGKKKYIPMFVRMPIEFSIHPTNFVDDVMELWEPLPYMTVENYEQMKRSLEIAKTIEQEHCTHYPYLFKGAKGITCLKCNKLIYFNPNLEFPGKKIIVKTVVSGSSCIISETGIRHLMSRAQAEIHKRYEFGESKLKESIKKELLELISHTEFTALSEKEREGIDQAYNKIKKVIENYGE